jgi:hypothetical protein
VEAFAQRRLTSSSTFPLLEASEGAKTSTAFLQISAEKSVGVVERKSRSGREFYNAAAEEDSEE